MDNLVLKFLTLGIKGTIFMNLQLQNYLQIFVILTYFLKDHKTLKIDFYFKNHKKSD